MAKHMTIDTRKGIAHGLDCQLTFAQMATMFGRAISTIANEVKNRMRWSNKSYGCTNAVCEHFDTCSKMYRTADNRKLLFKSQKRCFEMCEDFKQKVCEKLGYAPYVCNGCDKQMRCPLRKRCYFKGHWASARNIFAPSTLNFEAPKCNKRLFYGLQYFERGIYRRIRRAQF